MKRDLILKSITEEKRDGVEVLVSKYRVEHQNEDTLVFQDLFLIQGRNEGFTATMNMEDMEAQATADEALDKLANWMERMAEAIRLREPNDRVKVFQ